MSVTDTTTTEAQANQVPPEIRNFARNFCKNVRGIERSVVEGAIQDAWKIKAQRFNFHELPDGYEVGTVFSRRGRTSVIFVTPE